MKIERYIVFILAALVLGGCGAKKGIQKSEITNQKSEIPTWHTCLIQSARATVYTSDNKMASTITMQTVHDSMLVISVMPMMGIEMMRLEATPLELTVIDKMHGQYAQSTFAELNRKLTPDLNWDILQQVCTGELPTGNEKARLLYSFGDEPIEVVIDYSPRKLDVPVRVHALPTDKYKKIDVSKWL